MSDVSRTNEALIEKAHEATACRCVDAPEIECGKHGDDHSKMVADLADALEAKTGVRVDMSSAVGVEAQLAAGVPLRGEPKDDREALGQFPAIVLDRAFIRWRNAEIDRTGTLPEGFEMFRAGWNRAVAAVNGEHDHIEDGSSYLDCGACVIVGASAGDGAPASALESVIDVLMAQSVDVRRDTTALAEALVAGFPSLSRAGVPDATPTLCAECNETEVLGKQEHRVVCMDCAYEMGRCATVPDAATELLNAHKCHESAERAYERTIRAEAERDAATAAVERVKNVLTSWEGDEAAGLLPPDACLILSGVLAALDGAPEPEWEWGCRSSSHTPLNANVRTFYFLEDAQSHARDCQSPAIVRRRKAGPWEVCSE